ncbi:MAG: N-acetyltransferase [Leptolyngbya sp. SIO4C5]|uniref:GNAT family N-acetyltransferase n=1 Tax=Sphaerothrix gracilis TaxID=3151835 RepID=UPI0013BF2E28|nr:N-acetyltransferase [Leptolyngbya sp. SIO4C5]
MSEAKPKIKTATESDLPAILAIHRAAFGEEGEAIAALVTSLLQDTSAAPILSLLAIKDQQPVGHILFTQAQISESSAIAAVILAPLAVIPALQSQGIGTQLIQTGLKYLAATGTDLVFVLGYPDYYHKHGFQTASSLGLTAPYPIPPEHTDAWRVQALRSGVIGHVSGQVQCCDVLNQPKYWRE